MGWLTWKFWVVISVKAAKKNETILYHCKRRMASLEFLAFIKATLAGKHIVDNNLLKLPVDQLWIEHVKGVKEAWNQNFVVPSI